MTVQAPLTGLGIEFAIPQAFYERN